MSFAKLAEDLKAQQAALAASGAQATPGAGAGAGGEAAGGSGASTPLVKSFEFTLEDGTKVVAVDGAEMVKALEKQVAEDRIDLTTALTVMGDMLKSLTAQVAAMAGAGRGRMSTVAMPAATGADATATAAAAAAAAAGKPAKQDFNAMLAKAHELHDAGKMTGLDVATIEGYANRGMEVPEVMVKSFGLEG